MDLNVFRTGSILTRVFVRVKKKEKIQGEFFVGTSTLKELIDTIYSD